MKDFSWSLFNSSIVAPFSRVSCVFVSIVGLLVKRYLGFLSEDLHFWGWNHVNRKKNTAASCLMAIDSCWFCHLEIEKLSLFVCLPPPPPPPPTTPSLPDLPLSCPLQFQLQFLFHGCAAVVCVWCVCGCVCVCVRVCGVCGCVCVCACVCVCVACVATRQSFHNGSSQSKDCRLHHS